MLSAAKHLDRQECAAACRCVPRSPLRVPRSARGLTLVELLIVYVVLAGVIWLLVGLSRHVRDEAKQAQAVRLMSALSQALRTYERETGEYPPLRPSGQAAPPQAGGDDAAACLAALSELPASKAVLADRLPPRWQAMVGRPGAWPDPWGTPLRYVWPQPRAGGLGARAIPYVESAGRDRDFGDRTPRGLVRATDNLRTDEPLP